MCREGRRSRRRDRGRNALRQCKLLDLRRMVRLFSSLHKHFVCVGSCHCRFSIETCRADLSEAALEIG